MTSRNRTAFPFFAPASVHYRERFIANDRTYYTCSARIRHRLWEFVCTTGDTAHALRIGVPRSTANGWLLPKEQPIVTLSQFGLHVEELEIEVAKLRLQAAKLRHLVRLLFFILKLSGFSLQNCRIPIAIDKSRPRSFRLVVCSTHSDFPVHGSIRGPMRMHAHLPINLPAQELIRRK